MTEQALISQHRADWQALEALLRNRSLDQSQILELEQRYRAAASMLSYARTHFPGGTAQRMLMPLVARAYNAVYSGGRRRMRARDLYLREVPGALLRNFVYVLIAFVLFYGSGAFAFAHLRLGGDPALYMPAQYANMDYGDFDKRDWEQGYASSHIMTNNVQVTFNAFALGVTGVGTLYVLVMNGLMLGGVVSLAAGQGAMGAMGAWLLPHGVLELSAIVYSGAIGLMLFHAIAFPGKLRRGDALKVATRDSLYFLALAVPMLVCAGIIEGVFSGSDASRSAKMAVGAFTLLPTLAPWVYALARRGHLAGTADAATPEA